MCLFKALLLIPGGSFFKRTWVQFKRDDIFACQEKAKKSIILILRCFLFRLDFLS